MYIVHWDELIIISYQLELKKLRAELPLRGTLFKSRRRQLELVR